MDTDFALRQAFLLTNRAAAVCDESGRIIISNRAFHSASGFVEGVMPLGIRDLLGSADLQSPLRAVPEGLTHLSAAITALPAGSYPGRFYLVELFSLEGDSSLQDALDESEARYRKLQENLPVGIYRADEMGIIKAANPALIRMMGFRSFADLQEAAIEDVWVDPDDRTRLIDRLRKDGSVLGHTVHLKRKGDRDFIGSFDAHGTFDEEGRLLYFDTIVQDITEKVEALRELERLASTDGLTGISNRQNLMERLEHELRRAARYGKVLALLLIDLDHFKAVNDSLGHLAGDAVLRGAAELISGSLRDSDFPGRYGGEEFCVVLPETGLEGGIRMGSRIREAVEKHEFSTPDGKVVRITCSIGVAAGAPDRADDLISEADRRLYEAKRSGRNRVMPRISR